jgi:hypothetical protein
LCPLHLRLFFIIFDYDDHPSNQGTIIIIAATTTVFVASLFLSFSDELLSHLAISQAFSSSSSFAATVSALAL